MPSKPTKPHTVKTYRITLDKEYFNGKLIGEEKVLLLKGVNIVTTFAEDGAGGIFELLGDDNCVTYWNDLSKIKEAIALENLISEEKVPEAPKPRVVLRTV